MMLSKLFSSKSLAQKESKSQKIIGRAYQKFPGGKMALAWTGGKDSTLLLWLVREYVRDKNLLLPSILLINEGDVFDEIWDFAKKLSSQWGFQYEIIQNDDVLEKVNKIGDQVKVHSLSKRNQNELKRLRFKKESFVFEPESLVGCHLMKTVPQNMYLEQEGIKVLMSAIRWDEQEARANETYFSSRQNPVHTRVHPLLHFKEADVWQVIHQHKIPYVSLYEQGYRSLGARSSTGKADDKPAWEQDLEKTREREGRAQDKEKIMKRLRSLGYM